MKDLISECSQIENMIYEIRGKQVMLDSDLAKLYQCKNGTKTINQAVSRNVERFPERFSWILSDDESKNFLVPIWDQKNRIETRGGKYKNPRVFTEQGVAMLATILRTEVATGISIRIMDAFVAMRRYLSTGLVEQKLIEKQVMQNSENIEKHDKDIKLLQESFKKFEEKRLVNEIYFNGQIFDAYSKIIDIFKAAQNEIMVVDGYAEKTFLDIAKNMTVSFKLITYKKNSSFQSLFSKYQKQYSNVKVVYDNSFHDRYFILDQSTVYHCGTSINYAGSKTFSINKIEDDFVIKALIKKVNTIV